LVFFPIMLLALIQVFLGMFVILFPSIARDLLLIPLVNIPFVLILPAILGVIGGGLSIGRLALKYRKKVLISWGLLLAGLLVILLDLAVPFFRAPLFLSIFLGICLGFSFALIFAPSQTLVQEHTPFDVRGRVFAVINSLISLAALVPTLLTAALVDVLGIRVVLLGMGGAIIALSIYSFRGKYGLLGVNHRA
jgi:MFS family permease